MSRLTPESTGLPRHDRRCLTTIRRMRFSAMNTIPHYAGSEVLSHVHPQGDHGFSDNSVMSLPIDPLCGAARPAPCHYDRNPKAVGWSGEIPLRRVQPLKC